MTDAELSVRLEPDLTSIREARRFVQDVLDVWGIDGELASVVMVLVGELVTNALLHAEPPIDLALSHDGRVRGEVSDGTDKMPVPSEARHPSGRGGYGLQLVERMADAWGTERRADGKTVWFEIELQDRLASGS